MDPSIDIKTNCDLDIFDKSRVLDNMGLSVAHEVAAIGVLQWCPKVSSLLTLVGMQQKGFFVNASPVEEEPITFSSLSSLSSELDMDCEVLLGWCQQRLDWHAQKLLQCLSHSQWCFPLLPLPHWDWSNEWLTDTCNAPHEHVAKFCGHLNLWWAIVLICKQSCCISFSMHQLQSQGCQLFVCLVVSNSHLVAPKWQSSSARSNG